MNDCNELLENIQKSLQFCCNEQEYFISYDCNSRNINNRPLNI